MSHEHAPAESPLPIVDNSTLHRVIAEFSAQPGLEEATYWRMAVQQPVLSLQMNNFKELAGRNRAEQDLMKRAMVITYRLLEAQAEADSSKA